MSWILVPDCPHRTVEETAAIVAAALHTRPPLPPEAPPKAPPKAPQPPLPPNKAPPKAPPYPTVLLAQPKAPQVPNKSPPTLSPAASARDYGMAWPGGFIKYGIDEHGRLEAPGTFVRRREPPDIALSYTVDGEYHPRLPGDDPDCVYQWCRVAIPEYEYREYRHTLTWSPMESRFEGWFVAMPPDGDCSICGEAWSRHGVRCDEAWIEAAATTGLPEEDQTSEAATTIGLPEEEQSSEAADIEASRAMLQHSLRLEWYGGQHGGKSPARTSSGECSPVPPDGKC